MSDEIYPSDFTGWSPAESNGGKDYNIYNIDDTPMQYVPGYNPPPNTAYVAGISGDTSSQGASWLSGLTPFKTTSPGTVGGYVGSGGSSGGGSRAINYGSTQITSYLTNKSLPQYSHPAYDYGRVNFLAQQQAAPQLSKLQTGLYAGMGKINATDNPFMQGQARKQLLQGYGAGVSEIMQGATKTGEQLYGQEYSGLMQQAQANFQAALADYQKSFTTKTTTLPYADTGIEQSYADKIFGLPGGSVTNPLYGAGSEWERNMKNYLRGV